MDRIRKLGTLGALVALAVPLAACTTSNGPSAVGKKEIHTCRIAALGSEQETTLRGAIEPDSIAHTGNVVPTTVDTYATHATPRVVRYGIEVPRSKSVYLYYQHGLLVGRDCGTGHVQWRSGLGVVAKLEAHRATFVEGS